MRDELEKEALAIFEKALAAAAADFCNTLMYIAAAHGDQESKLLNRKGPLMKQSNEAAALAKQDACARCPDGVVSSGRFLCDSCRAKHYEKFPMDVRGHLSEPLADRQERRRRFRRPSLEEREKLRAQRRELEAEHRADHQELHRRLAELEARLVALEPK